MSNNINTVAENAYESLAAIFTKAEQDQVFAARLAECATPHEIFVLGQDVITSSEEDFTAACEALQAYMTEQGELSDEELDAVAGGGLRSWMQSVALKKAKRFRKVEQEYGSIYAFFDMFAPKLPRKHR